MFGPSDQSFRNPEGAMGLVRIYGGVVLDESPPNEPAPSLRFLQKVALRTIPSGRFVGLECASLSDHFKSGYQFKTGQRK
jgi:hypothetical protein